MSGWLEKRRTRISTLGWLTDHLREAIGILEAYQFPVELRAELAIKELEEAIAAIKKWAKED